MVTVLAFFIAEKKSMVFKAGFAVAILAVFFGLRIFSESTASKIVVGAIYYIFTVCATGTVLLACTDKEKQN